MLFPKRPVFALFFCAVLVSGSAAAQRGEYAARATAMLDSLYTYYSVPGTRLLRENYPDDGAFSVQFHPEARSGPQDTGFLFDRFTALMEEW